MAGTSRSKESLSSSAAALRILQSHSVLTLATVYQGKPHAVSLMYANQAFTLYWVSDPGSRHSLGIADAPETSITIADHFTDFRLVEGLQGRGTAHRLNEKAEIAQGLQLLADRYEFFQEFLTGPASLVRRLNLAAVYRFDPTELTLVDNTKGFGHKEAVPLRFRD